MKNVEIKYINYYKCPIDFLEWQDSWDSMCNDKCPMCDKEIEPHTSFDIKRRQFINHMEVK